MKQHENRRLPVGDGRDGGSGNGAGSVTESIARMEAVCERAAEEAMERATRVRAVYAADPDGSYGELTVDATHAEAVATAWHATLRRLAEWAGYQWSADGGWGVIE